MVNFKKKEIQRYKTLGERLKKVREEAGISLEEAGAQTQIRKKYLVALEEGDYKSLPGEIYIKNFFKKYAEFLQVSPDMVLAVFQQEGRAYKKELKEINLKPKIQKQPKSIVLPKIAKYFVIVLVILICLSYLGYELKKVLAPPSLEIIYPPNNLSIKENNITIEGKTEPESNVYINNQQIFLDSEGRFKEKIGLQNGLNNITITSRKKEGRETTVTRSVLVESNSS